ncbi:MAG: hypothetical protein J6C51_01230 [Clostridia bacterium]|nr:hypothetical protein [Clostridia bacterium]
MRKLKSIFSVLLAVCLLLSTCTVALATEVETKTYSVTLDGSDKQFTDAVSSEKYFENTVEIPEGQTLEAMGYIYYSGEIYEGSPFLGWSAYTVDADGNETLVESGLPQEKMWAYPITADTKFVAKWADGYVIMHPDRVKNVTFEVQNPILIQVTLGDYSAPTYTEGEVKIASLRVPLASSMSDVGISEILAVDPAGVYEVTGWDVYIGDAAEPSVENATTEQILNMLIDVPRRFVARVAETNAPSGGEGDREPQTMYGVTFMAGGVPFMHQTPDTIGEIGEEFGTAVEAGTSLAENGISVWQYPENDAAFLGWHAYRVEPTGDVDTGVLSAEELHALKIDAEYRFEAEWDLSLLPGGNEPGFDDVPSVSASAINLDGSYGSFKITTKNGNNTDVFTTEFTRFDMDVEPGLTLKDLGVTEISEIKFWDGKREFLGWNVYKLDIVHDSEGNELYWDEILVHEKPLTTDEIMNYPAIDGDLTFRIAWAGDDSDYMTHVDFDGVRGEFKVTWDPEYPEDSTDTTEYTGFSLKQNGKTIGEQEPARIVSDPVREGYTFEGWLALPMNYSDRYTASTKLYTTEEVYKLPVPADDVIFTAKWKEISIYEYLYGDPYFVSEDDYHILLMNGNGGNIIVNETYKDDEKPEEWKNEYYAYDAEGKLTFEEQNKKWGWTTNFITAEKDRATLEGWTTYTADDYYQVDLEKGKELNITDPAITAVKLFEDTFQTPDGEKTYVTYILLLNAKVYSETLTPEDALKLSGSNYFMTANWADWMEVKIEGSDEKYMLNVNTSEIAVPTAAQEKYETVEKAKEALKEAALNVPSIDKDKAETVYYEIQLMVEKEGKWEVVTAENFPKEGVKIVIPYNGLDPEKLDFVVTHLVSAGEKAGEIEILKHTEGKTGLEAVVYSLSPFGVTYQNAAPAELDDVPQTGDMSTQLYVSVAAAIAVAGLLILAAKKLIKA